MSHLIELNKYYSDLPFRMKKFCEELLDIIDYNKFFKDFKERWNIKHIGIDGRHSLWKALIDKVLNSTISWPKEPFIESRKISELPEEEKIKIIDYIGYLIGMPQGQGNDSLARIYKKYF